MNLAAWPQYAFYASGEELPECLDAEYGYSLGYVSEVPYVYVSVTSDEYFAGSAYACYSYPESMLASVTAWYSCASVPYVYWSVTKYDID